MQCVVKFENLMNQSDYSYLHGGVVVDIIESWAVPDFPNLKDNFYPELSATCLRSSFR